MKIYPSKIGLEFVIPMTLIVGTVFVLIIIEGPIWLAIAFLLPIVLFFVHIFKSTYYVIAGEELIVKCGFIFNKTIDIKTIKKIAETNNPISSPATSIDRLEIKYGKFSSVIISPKDKAGFIDDIKRLNPDVEVHVKKGKIPMYQPNNKSIHHQ